MLYFACLIEDSTTTPGSESTNDTALIVGICVGVEGALLLAGCGIIIYFCIKKRKHRFSLFSQIFIFLRRLITLHP